MQRKCLFAAAFVIFLVKYAVAYDLDVNVISATFQRRDTYFVRLLIDGKVFGHTKPITRNRSPTWNEHFHVTSVTKDTVVQFEAWEYDLFTLHDLQFTQTLLVGDDLMIHKRSGSPLRLDAGPSQSLLVKLTLLQPDMAIL